MLYTVIVVDAILASTRHKNVKSSKILEMLKVEFK